MKENMVDIEAVKKGVLRKFPLLGATMSTLKFEVDDSLDTAGTDGETVYYSSKYLGGLSLNEQIFVMSHEIMHVEFEHIPRSKNKNMEIWNIATDAVINQMLKYEGLDLDGAYVNMPEALDKSAEDMYEVLCKKKENSAQNNSQNNKNNENNSQNQNTNKNQSQNGNQQNRNGRENQSQQDDNYNPQNHKNWEEAAKKIGENNNGKNNTKNNAKINSNQQGNSLTDSPKNEKGFNEQNRELKKQIAEKIRQGIKQQATNAGKQAGEKIGSFGKVDDAKEILSWKKLLRKELEKEEDRWSYRRANEDNHFCAKVESLDAYERPITQVLLDTSGSIDDDLLKGFIMQLKPLLKESKLYVGCFDTKFYGFKEIKSKRDVDEFKFEGRGGTSFNVAAHSFSKDNKINKIIFTDGDDELTQTEDLKKTKIMWVVFDNPSFKTDIGKVIHVNSRDLYISNKKLQQDELSL